MFFQKLVNVNIPDLLSLINGVGLGDHACSLHDAVALSKVSPPHMLVCDLYDVYHREPALLTIGQAAAFVKAWEDKKERREEDKHGKFGGFCIFHA